MKKYLVIIAFISITPYVAFASWWNPLSWNIFSGIFQNNSQIQIASTTQITTTSTTKTTTVVSSTPNVNQSTKKIARKNIISVTAPVSSSQTTSTISACPQGYNCVPNIPTTVTDSSQSCGSGYTFDKEANKCVTPLTYCQSRDGTNATYNSVNNSCGCATGYIFDSNNICVVQENISSTCQQAEQNLQSLKNAMLNDPELNALNARILDLSGQEANVKNQAAAYQVDEYGNSITSPTTGDFLANNTSFNAMKTAQEEGNIGLEMAPLNIAFSNREGQIEGAINIASQAEQTACQ